jgi:cellulose synthase/poly-beta-1,6-N-acetylglucosamine synthase-like glycosyltransferase
MGVIQQIVDSAAVSQVLVDAVRGGLTGLYLAMLLLVALFGLHRWHLVYLYYKHRKNSPKNPKQFQELPTMTIQLPMYNEPFVAERIISKTCEIEYPREKLQIQVLDDSTDNTPEIAREVVARFAAAGHNIVYIRRDNREGYKAGALENGLKTATGEIVSIFDADFVPQPEILMKTIHYFTDPNVGMVQTRWEHINRKHSLLTQTQSILLDGHFVMEHAARNRSGRFMNFNGTAGLWRRKCIESGGGWEHDTLTEDMDLSYRCQMRGWRFVYLPEITVPAELPPEIQGFKQQQFRWTKGSIQTGKKMLPRILRSKLPWRVKLEAVFHMMNPMSYIFMSVLIFMLLPVFCLRISILKENFWAQFLFDISLFAIASCSASTFYMCSQKEIFRTWKDKIKFLPFLMSLGVGMALNNSRGIFEALFGEESAFERTPKFGVSRKDSKIRWREKARSFGRKGSLMPFLELAFGVYVTVCIVLSFQRGLSLFFSLPFLMVFAIGYFYVGINTLWGTWLSQFRKSTEPEPALKSSAA